MKNMLPWVIAAFLGVVLICWLVFFGLLGMAFDAAFNRAGGA